jgi:DNA-nicking Smr family endonuclease
MKKKSLNDLSDLGALKQTLAKAAADKAAAELARHLAREKAEREARVFQDAVAGATPIIAKPRAPSGITKPEPRALQFERDEKAALWQTLSDDMDIERLLDTDASLSYRRPGIGEDVTRRLRRGDWVVQDQIDLHGLRVDEARSAMAEFFSQADKRNLRCLRIIHGKGLGSVNKEPVLKTKAMRWLVQREDVIAFCQARPNDGGAGALIVLLNAKTGSPTNAR